MGSNLSAAATTDDVGPGTGTDLGAAIADNGDIDLEVDIPPELLQSPLHQLYLERLAEGRDLRVIISADSSATGVGKTTLAVYLAELWDVHGWSPERNTLDAREYSVLYDSVPKGSVLTLDEAEQAIDRRRSMAKETLAIGHDFATKRYRQVIGVLTLPSKDMMDQRIADKLCDVWIVVEERGLAKVYVLDENVFTGKVYYHHVETLRWPPLDDHPSFLAVEEEKEKRMTNQTQSRYVHRDEVEDLKENFWNKAQAKTTFRFVRTAYDLAQSDQSSFSLTQSDLADIIGRDQSTVSRMTRADSFEDYYSSHNSSDDFKL